MGVERYALGLCVAGWLLACQPAPEEESDSCDGCSDGGSGGMGGSVEPMPTSVRVAQFNIRELSTDKLLDPNGDQISAAVDVIARIAPDIIGINEMQYDIQGMPNPSAPGVPLAETQIGSHGGGAENARRLADRVSAVNPQAVYADALNTLGNSGFYWEGGTMGQASFVLRGWGEWEGRHNTGILSRYPILHEQVRVIADFAWEDLPDNLIAQIEADTGVVVPSGFPLFEKSLNIVPIQLPAEVLYLVMLHPVPPAFEEINPYRNHDELRGLSLFLDGALPGVEPLPADAKYVVIGDLNADPEDGDGSIPGAIQQVIDHPALVAWFPTGSGAKGTHGDRNTYLSGCGYNDGGTVQDPMTQWQMQLDYLLPSQTLGTPAGGGVFWPDHVTAREDFDVSCRASDHHLLYADFALGTP